MDASPKDILIVGQGIAGTMLAWHAIKANLIIDVLDINSESSASTVSSGIINPVTGSKFVKSWRIDELFPYAKKTYTKIEKELDLPIVSNMPLWRHIPDVKSENLWDSRAIDPHYEGLLSRPDKANDLKKEFPNSYQFGIVNPALKINVKDLIASLRMKWQNKGILHEMEFKPDELTKDGKYFIYNGLQYKSVILAAGYKGINFSQFKTSAYRPVKGEVLLCMIEHFPEDRMIKNGKFLIPLGDQTFWIGSNYQHQFESNEPDKDQISDLVDFLENSIRQPYSILKHIAGVRPSTKYRQPLIGEHPEIKKLYLFNGLGTKGISLAPFFSHRMIHAIAENQAVKPTDAFRKSFP